MNIHLVTKPFNYIVIDEFYTDEELALIMQEVSALEPYALNADSTNSSIDENGVSNKTGRGIFLNELFQKDISVSKILNVSRKIFCDNLTEVFKNFDPSFNHIRYSNRDAVLLNYYKNGEKYLPHRDDSAITAVTFLKEGEFDGGNFIFPEYNETVLAKHNRVVIFHGCMEHQAEEIKTDGESYRITLAHFIGYK